MSVLLGNTRYGDKVINLVELITFIVVAVLFSYMLFAYIYISIKNKQMFVKLVQAEVDKKALLMKIEKLASSKENKSIEETAGFLKFLTQSRDWAFGYIEDVQEAIEEVRAAWDPVIEAEVPYLNEKEIESVKSAYNKLISSLPVDTKND
jgi:GTP:adenosylcobinamide-phosphate guanylyltransferase